jgi:hypothetical protein
MGSIALIAPKGREGIAYAVERLREGLNRDTTCEQDYDWRESNFGKSLNSQNRKVVQSCRLSAIK